MKKNINTNLAKAIIYITFISILFCGYWTISFLGALANIKKISAIIWLTIGFSIIYLLAFLFFLFPCIKRNKSKIWCSIYTSFKSNRFKLIICALLFGGFLLSLLSSSFNSIESLKEMINLQWAIFAISLGLFAFWITIFIKISDKFHSFFSNNIKNRNQKIVIEIPATFVNMNQNIIANSLFLLFSLSLLLTSTLTVFCSSDTSNLALLNGLTYLSFTLNIDCLLAMLGDIILIVVNIRIKNDKLLKKISKQKESKNDIKNEEKVIK